MRQADRLIINVLSNYGLTLVGGLASLVMVPIVIHDLTKSGYGLAAMLLATFTVTETLGQSINRAMQRFIPQHMAGNDKERVSITFNSALACHAILGCIAALIIWFIRPWYLDDPSIGKELHDDGTVAFAFVAITLALGAPLFAYRAGLEAIQRFDLAMAHVSVGTVLRTIAVIIFFKLGYGSITVFAVSQLIAIEGSCFLCRRALLKTLPDLRESPALVRASAVKSLAMFALAGLMITGGNVLGLEGFRILIGKGLGMAEAGGLSAILAFRTMVFVLIRSMTNVLTPTVSAMDAKGANANVAKLLLASTKYSAVAAASVCLVPLGVAHAFLVLWLGSDFSYLEQLMYTVMLAQIPLAMSTSTQQVLVGLGRMSVTGPTVLLRGAGSLVAAGLYLYLSKEPTLVGAAIWLYVVQIAGSMFLVFYGAGVTQVGRLRSLWEGMVLPTLLGVLAGAVTWIVASRVGTHAWWRLFLSIGTGEIIFLGLVLFIGLGAEERARLASFLGRVKAKLRPSQPAGAGHGGR